MPVAVKTVNWRKGRAPAWSGKCRRISLASTARPRSICTNQSPRSSSAEACQKVSRSPSMIRLAAAGLLPASQIPPGTLAPRERVRWVKLGASATALMPLRNLTSCNWPRSSNSIRPWGIFQVDQLAALSKRNSAAASIVAEQRIESSRGRIGASRQCPRPIVVWLGRTGFAGRWRASRGPAGGVGRSRRGRPT